jgi:hypothetical protein
MRADPSAMGSVPAAAHQYCEAVRAASSYGWYVFPPCDVSLRWNGSDIFYQLDEDWLPLISAPLDGLAPHWDAHCPPALRGMAPPFLTATQARGVVQIWSGLMVSTAPRWSVHVRPIANAPQSRLFNLYEGIVETDEYGPWPLFINIQLLATDTIIALPKDRPMMQVQPLMREVYSASAHQSIATELDDPLGMTAADWQGYRKTIRTSAPDDEHAVGGYASAVRKRNKAAADESLA